MFGGRKAFLFAAVVWVKEVVFIIDKNNCTYTLNNNLPNFFIYFRLPIKTTAFY